MPIWAHQLLRLMSALTLSIATMAFLSWHPVGQQLSVFVQGFIALGVITSIDRLFFGWGIAAHCPECGTRAVAASFGPNSEYLCESPTCPLG